MRRLLFSVSQESDKENNKFIFETKGHQPLTGQEMVSLAAALIELSNSLLLAGLGIDSSGAFTVDSITDKKPPA